MSVLPTTFNLQGGATRQSLATPLPFGTGLVATGSAGAAAQIILPANPASPNIITQIYASLSAAAAGPVTVIILDGATERFRWQIGTGGLFMPPITFEPALAGGRNTTMTVTISAPGGAVVASLVINAYVLL